LRRNPSRVNNETAFMITQLRELRHENAGLKAELDLFKSDTGLQLQTINQNV